MKAIICQDGSSSGDFSNVARLVFNGCRSGDGSRCHDGGEKDEEFGLHFDGRVWLFEDAGFLESVLIVTNSSR